MSGVDKEQDYFHHQDQEALNSLKTQVEKEQAEAALAERRAAHHHKCGKCGADMTTAVFKGLDVEICNDCGAVLLDKGELQSLAGQDESGIVTFLAELFGFAHHEGDSPLMRDE